MLPQSPLPVCFSSLPVLRGEGSGVWGLEVLRCLPPPPNPSPPSTGERGNRAIGLLLFPSGRMPYLLGSLGIRAPARRQRPGRVVPSQPKEKGHRDGSQCHSASAHAATGRR